MADYCCTIRTNYFRVNDEEGFRRFMEHVRGEDDVEVWDSVDKNGVKRFAFGCYGTIDEWYEAEGDEGCDGPEPYDLFIDGLQKFLPDDEAILIFEAGNEKMRYVLGLVSVITNKSYDHTDIMSVGQEMAGKLLGRPDWTTRCDY